MSSYIDYVYHVIQSFNPDYIFDAFVFADIYNSATQGDTPIIHRHIQQYRAEFNQAIVVYIEKFKELFDPYRIDSRWTQRYLLQSIDTVTKMFTDILNICKRHNDSKCYDDVFKVYSMFDGALYGFLYMPFYITYNDPRLMAMNEETFLILDSNDRFAKLFGELFGRLEDYFLDESRPEFHDYAYDIAFDSMRYWVDVNLFFRCQLQQLYGFFMATVPVAASTDEIVYLSSYVNLYRELSKELDKVFSMLSIQKLRGLADVACNIIYKQ